MQSQAILAHQPPPPWLSTHIFSSDLGEILFVSFTLLKKRLKDLSDSEITYPACLQPFKCLLFSGIFVVVNVTVVVV